MAEASPIERAVLCIETGMHGATLRDAAMDPAGRVLVTAGDDKTARVWSLPDLQPLGVLRPPVGPGNEGKLFAVAVAPDGQTAAVGGFTGRDGSGDYSIYVFDLISRSIVSRLPGLPNIVNSLAFAADGRLAAGLHGDKGIRVWRDRASLFADREYSADVYGVAFAPDGRLAAGSWDGHLRLYDQTGTLLRKQKTEAGARPFRLLFSPDGQWLAVGFQDVAVIEVRDGATLALSARPDVSGLGGTRLSRVAWSADNNTVFAGGDVWDGSGQLVLAWSEAGSGARHIAAQGFGNGVTAILSLPLGELVAASGSGDLAVVSQDGQRRQERSPPRGDLRPIVDLKGRPRRLLLSANGRQVEWVTLSAPNRVLRFDAANLPLDTGKDETPGVSNWTGAAGDLRVTDWEGRMDPKLNGRTLTLGDYEIAQSVSVAHNRLLLGTAWCLRLLDALGKETWSVPTPGMAWRVNQSTDGRLAVAALGDGTIRWYRADTGQELLALMVTEDAQRWVAFTPSGYYAAGPGSEDLIGWHVNRGTDQAADFFPASRFRDRFDRPDVVRRMLETLDEAQALQQADAARGTDVSRLPAPAALAAELLQDRPPVVTILSPRAGAIIPDQAELLIEARSPTGRPITFVEARINGRPATDLAMEPPEPAAAPAGELAQRRWIRLTLPADEDCTIQVIARCEDRISDAATLFRGRRVAAPSPTSLNKPRLNALLVGISNYQNNDLRLKFAAKDASDLATALRRQEGGLYREVNIDIIPEAEATRKKILQQLVELQRRTTQRDLAILFLAGHGVAEDIEYYFLTVDADPETPSVELSGTDLRQHLRRIAGRTMVFLDTCYAGAIIDGRSTRNSPLDISKFLNELASPETGVIVYSATTGRQRAEEHVLLRNGVFTAALLETLDGRAGQSAEEPIRLNGLGTLLAERVRALSQGKQTPVFNPLDPLPDLPLFLVR